MGELAILIPLAPFILGGFAIWSKHRQREIEAGMRSAAEDAARYAAQNERLEQRVQTLERIITDKGFDVSTQIENLRDRPLN